MLAAMRALLAGEPEPMQVDYALEWTEVWDDATAAAAASRQSGAGGTAAWLADDRVLEELRLEPDTYLAVRDRALLRLLAAREAARRRHAAGRRRAARAARSAARAPRPVQPRRPRSLARGERDRWPDGWSGWSTRRRSSRRSARSPTPALPGQLLDELRLRNDFARFAERARGKQEFLEAHGLDHPDPDDPHLGAAGRGAGLVFRAAAGPAAARRHRRGRARARLRRPGRFRSRAAPRMAILQSRKAGDGEASHFASCPRPIF